MSKRKWVNLNILTSFVDFFFVRMVGNRCISEIELVRCEPIPPTIPASCLRVGANSTCNKYIILSRYFLCENGRQRLYLRD